jgi:hypothetical protein
MSKEEHGEHKHFAPWMRDFKVGTIFSIPGGLCLLYSYATRPFPIEVGVAGVALLGIGFIMLRQGFTRWNGKQIEQSSIRSLSLPDHWTVKPNYMLSDGGDIDLYLESPDGERFAIEIKTIQGLVVKHTWMGFGKTELLTPIGKKLKDDPIPQTLRNAEAVLATPVLWLPRASGKTVKTKSGVIIVQGGKRQLYKAIGVKSGWSLW